MRAKTDGLPLFDEPTGPDPRARRSDPWTSKAAAASMTDGAESQRRKCYELLEARGGLTADEIDVLVGWRDTTAGRRLPELEEAGLVRKTDATRKTRSGRQATVWELVR